jgi:hypothetical protein
VKKSKYPRLRSKTYKGAGGQVWVYYTYDMRGTGKPDVRLGTDYALAIEQWKKLHLDQPLTVGRIQEAIDRWREFEIPKYGNTGTRNDYTKQLRRVEAAFGQMAWHEVNLPVLRTYLDLRTAKTQGNRELSVLSIVWGKARLWGMTELQWPAAGLKDWKNPESARQFEVTDAMFDAVYQKADQVLRDAMDIATATGMRLTDVRTVRMPVDGRLRFKAGKTGKWAYFEVAQSPVLTALLERRGNADSVMLLTTKTGRQVSASMLRDRYDEAREAAAKANPALAKDIRAMYLRDMRKRAADLAEDNDAASKLLQHSSKKVTDDHYRTKGTRLKAVR